MPEPSQAMASAVIAGIIEGVCNSCDLKCSVTTMKAESDQQEKVIMEYLVEVEGEEQNRWDAKKNWKSFFDL